MANVDLRPGNAYTLPTVRLTNADGSAFPLSQTTVVLTASDQLGNPVLTHTLTVNAFGDAMVSDGLEIGPDGAASGVVINVLTADETAALSGWYHWVMTLTDVDGNSFDVASGGWNVILREPYRVPGGVSRRALRRNILRRLGDLLVVRATANGGTSTLIDQVHLIGQPDTYRGRTILFTGGTIANLGEQRYITGSSRQGRSITFDFDLPAATMGGDEAEMANMRGMGYSFDDVHMAIDEAIENASEATAEPALLAVSATFSRLPGVIALPDDWVAVTGIQYTPDDTTSWTNVSYAGTSLGNGWDVDMANRTIVVSGAWGTRLDGRPVQVVGMRKPRPLVFDDDETGVNAEWLVAECMSRLSTAAYRRNPTKERNDMMAFDMNQAAIIRSRVIKRSSPNTIRLTR